MGIVRFKRHTDWIGNMGEIKHTSIEVNELRNDLWVRTYGTPVQCEKQGSERRKYQHPELYGMPNEMGINYHP